MFPSHPPDPAQCIFPAVGWHFPSWAEGLDEVTERERCARDEDKKDPVTTQRATDSTKSWVKTQPWGHRGKQRSCLQTSLFLFHLAWALSSCSPRNVVIQVYIPIKLDFEFKIPFGLWREFTQGMVWAGTLCSLFWEPRGSARWGWSCIQ